MSKKNIYLGIALIALSFVAYFYASYWPEWKQERKQPKNFLANINMDVVDIAEISGNGKTFLLEKSDGRWKISGTKDFYVEDALSARLLSVLKEAQKAALELASENKDRKKEFGIIDGAGAQVKLRQGDKVLAEFSIGDSADNYASAYVSPSGSDQTFLIKAALNELFVRDDWHDKRIFLSDKDRITKIRFQYPKSEFRVEKSGETWAGVAPSRFAVSKDKIVEIAGIMASMTAVEIPKQDFAGTGLEKSPIIVQATGDNIDNTIMIGNSLKSESGEEYYYAKKSASDNIYLITKKDRDLLNRTIRDLK